MKTNIFQIIRDKFLCTLYGHIDVIFGRYTHDDDSTVERGYVRLYYICSRCGRVINMDVVDMKVETK